MISITREVIRRSVRRDIARAAADGAFRYGPTAHRKITFKQEEAYRLRGQDFYGLNVKEAAEVMGVTPREVNSIMQRVQKIAPQLFPVLPPRMAKVYSLFMSGHTTTEIAEHMNISRRLVQRVLHWLWMRRKYTGVYFRSNAGRQISYKPSLDRYVREKF